jgi:hypothetical protein
MKASLGVDEFLRHTFLITSRTLKDNVEKTTFTLRKS